MCADMPAPRTADRQRLRIVGSPRKSAAIRPEGPFDRSTCRGTRHGDYLAYSRFGCTCPDARFDMRCYRAASAGRHLQTMVDATGAERRLRGLAHQRWGSPDIAPRVRLGRRQVRVIRSGRIVRVHAETHFHVAAATVDLAERTGRTEQAWRAARQRGWYPLDAWVGGWIDDPSAAPYLGHRRRLEALAVDGWPLWAVAGACDDVTVDDLVEMWLGRPAAVGTGAAVLGAFERLTGPGPSVECREWAAFRRFWPALAWDDDTIDDPDALASVGGPEPDDESWVDPVVVEQLRLGVAHLGPWVIPQRQWLVADLTDRGRSAAEIVGLLGVSVRTVERDRASIALRHTKQVVVGLGPAAIAG